MSRLAVASALPSGSVGRRRTVRRGCLSGWAARSQPTGVAWRLRKRLRSSRGLWTESEPLDHQGEFFFGKQMLVEPKPVQKPYPEFWWAGERKRSLKLAARYGRYLELHGESIAWGGQHPLERIREFYAPALGGANEQWGGSAKLSIQIGARVTERPLTPAGERTLYWFDDRPDSGLSGGASGRFA